MTKRLAAAIRCAVVATSVLSPKAVNAQLEKVFKPSLGLDVTAGLDDKTQDFIKGMLPAIHQEMLGLLKDALPLVDKSVELYISKLNDVMTNQINNLQCTIEGSGKVVVSDLKTVITGHEPEPVQDLAKALSSLVVSFSSHDKPEVYENRYADFLANAAVTRCQVNLSAEAARSVATKQADIRPRWLVWYRLGDSCPAAMECVAYLRASVEKLMSDKPRDSERVNAATKLAAIGIPKPRSVLQITYDQSPYEQTLQTLFTIQDSVNMAEAARKATAMEAWDSASSAVHDPQSGMNRLYANESSQVNWPTNANQDWYNAIGRCKELVRMITEINGNAKDAAGLDPKYADDYQNLNSQLKAKLEGTYQLYTKAAQGLNTLGAIRFGGGVKYPVALPKYSLD